MQARWISVPARSRRCATCPGSQGTVVRDRRSAPADDGTHDAEEQDREAQSRQAQPARVMLALAGADRHQKRRLVAHRRRRALVFGRAHSGRSTVVRLVRRSLRNEAVHGEQPEQRGHTTQERERRGGVVHESLA